MVTLAESLKLDLMSQPSDSKKFDAEARRWEKLPRGIVETLGSNSRVDLAPNRESHDN